MVVVFDSIRTTKSYVQMKGRARKQNAKFFVLEDRLDKANKAVLSLVSAQDMERRLQEFIEQKTKRNSLDLERMDASCEDMSSEPELDALRQGYFKSENAIVDLQSAKSLLNRYSISVPLDPFVRCSRETLLAHMPEYRENILILPSHLPGRIRRVILPEEFWNRPIGEKWKLLSLAACVRLHAHGLLNHRLLPLNRSDMHNKIRRATTNRFVDVKPIPLPLETFFCDHGTQQIFIHTIRHESESYLRCERILQGQGHYLGLITFEPLTNIILPISIFHKEFGIVTTSLGPSSEERCNNEQMNRLREVFLLLMNERWRRQSRNMYFRFRKRIEYISAFMPYLVGILSQEGRLDWDLMSDLLLESKRTRDERKTAMASLSITEKLAKPRLWISIKDNHTSYIAYGPANQKASADFPAQKEGVKTYQDYFEKYREIIIPLNDQLFDTQRYWTQPSTFLTVSPSDSQEIPTIKTSGVKYEMCPELSAIKVPHSACMEATIANAHIGLLTCFLPQVLFAFERYVNSNAFIKFCDANLPLLGSYLGRLPIESVATAMTAKSCGLHVSYEKLEWLGDAVLKMIQTESLLKSVELREWIQFLHEGDLSILRQG